MSAFLPALALAVCSSSVSAAPPPWKASDFEASARFMSFIQRGDLASAKRMMTPNATIQSWSDYQGPSKTLRVFANYMNKCPIISNFEGVATNDSRNMNVNLGCGDAYGNASLHFQGGKISEINFGGPPPVMTISR